MRSAIGTRTLDDIGPLLDMLFERSPLAVALHDRGQRVVYLNRAMAALGPAPTAAYVGQPLAQTAPLIGTSLTPFLQHVLETGTMVSDFALSDGRRHWAGSCHPLRAPDGTMLGVCSILHNDTERSDAERRLDWSEDRYRTLIELSPDGVAILEEETIAYVNPSGVRILGARHAAEVVHRAIWDFVPPDTAAGAWRQPWERAIDRGGGPHDSRILRLDGAEAILSVRSVALDRGGAPAMQVVFRDVTRQRAEERTRDQVRVAREMERALLQAILHELPVGVVMIDGHGKLMLANDAAERIWGEPFGPWPLPIAPWLDRVELEGDELMAERPLRMMRALGELGENDVAREVVCGDGVTRSLRGSVTTIANADGTTRGVLATFSDATALARTQEELRRSQEALEARVVERTASLAAANERLRQEGAEREAAERQLRMSERLAAIGTLAAGVAHEVNNPLAAIVATAELARAINADGGRHVEVDAALARIVEEAHRGGVIVKSLLRFGRQDQVERWPVDVNGLVRRLADSARIRSVLEACRLRTRFARESMCVVIDPTELEQLVLNLVQNAVQAGAREIGLRTAVRAGCARIVVRDDGHGIDPHDIERIFDPFFTTRGSDGGTGLGLSVVHGIVARYDGRIGVESRVGRGTRFTVDLPAGRAA